MKTRPNSKIRYPGSPMKEEDIGDPSAKEGASPASSSSASGPSVSILFNTKDSPTLKTVTKFLKVDSQVILVIEVLIALFVRVVTT